MNTLGLIGAGLLVGVVGTVATVLSLPVQDTSPDALTASLHAQLLTLKGLHQVSCEALFGLQIADAQCFLSHAPRDRLKARTEEVLNGYESGGWSNDYGVWGAFYHDRRSGLAFGVNVLDIEGDSELRKNPLTRGSVSVLNFVVDPPQPGTDH